MKTYTVRAQRWERGWELHIEGVGVTQSHSLADAEAMARSYVDMTSRGKAGQYTLTIIPYVGDGLDEDYRNARDAVREAEAAQRRAAAANRSIARRLRARGLSGRDIAALLRISPQRVSQLLNAPDPRDALGDSLTGSDQSR